jgi:hypothetical protein
VVIGDPFAAVCCTDSRPWLLPHAIRRSINEDKCRTRWRSWTPARALWRCTTRRYRPTTRRRFGYFLAIERKRSEVSSRPFLLLLVDLKPDSGAGWQIDPHVASELLAMLSRRLRETDFVGWYREDQVIGAVLTQRAEMICTDVSLRIGQRFKKALCEGLPREVARRLQVRVYQLSAEAPELSDPATFTERKSG